MAFDVTIQPSGHQFEVDDDETVLEAALRQGFAFPYGCRNGACGSCKGRVLEGEVDHGPKKPPGISEAELAAGQALFCQAVPVDDLIIEVREIGAAKDIVLKTLPCRVAEMQRVAPDVMILKLQLPATERVQFLAGQYLDVLLRDGSRRSYSLANAPEHDQQLEIHVRHVAGGAFSETVFTTMKPKALLRIEAPLGSFFLDPESTRPRLFVAGGTGFGPIKGMLDHLASDTGVGGNELFWGARDAAGFYLPDWLQSRVAEGLMFTPVISGENADAIVAGCPAIAGFPHDAVVAAHPDLSGFDVYVAGPPAMVDACKAAFAAAGLPDDRLFNDSFLPAV